MSDIAKKTLPPGSWPHKAGDKSTPGPNDDAASSEVAAPRSIASHAQDQASDAAGRGGEVHSPGSRNPKDTEEDDLYSQGRYTTATNNNELHRDELTEIPEESDANRGTTDDGVRSLDDVEPEPMGDDEGQNTHINGAMNGGESTPHQQLQANGEAGEEDMQANGVHAEDAALTPGASESQVDDPARPQEEATNQAGERFAAVESEAAGREEGQDGAEQQTAASQAPGEEARQQEAPSQLTGSLTDRAKHLFDLASVNQPTSEARDSFLQNATEAKESQDALEEDQEHPGVDVQDWQTQDGAGSQVPTERREQEEQQPPRITPSQVGSAVPADLRDRILQGEVISSSQLGSDVPTEAREQIEQLQEQMEQQKQQQLQPQISPSQIGSDVPTVLREKLLQGEHIDPSQFGSDVPPDVRDRVLQLQEQQEQQQQLQPQISPSQIGSDVPTVLREKLLQGEHIDPSQFGSDVPPDVRDRVLQLQEQQEQQRQQAQAPGSQAPDADADADEVNTYRPAPTIPSTDMQDELMANFSALKDGRVNKGGNIVNESGRVVGRVTQGQLQHLIGRTVDEEGNIWSSSGKVIGRAEPLSEDELEELAKEPSPFESFPGATVNADGYVVADNGEIVGKVVAGDLSVLRGKEVDADGDILDRAGNTIGQAERWEPEPEEEPEPEVEADRSILAGKRVNKAGNVVDSAGNIFGRVVEGDVRSMVGRMCDRLGNILSESGDVIGRAEVVAEGERDGLKEGPFAELEGCTVAKDGTVVTPAGDIVGRLVTGDPKVLFGRAVDEDGDVLDRNGNVLGKAERWQPEEVQRKKNPMSGRRVNREGNVVDEDGNVIGKLTTGNLQVCSGKEIDDDGDVVDSKGTVIGHCSLLDDIPVDEEESAEEKAKREQLEQDRKLAIQMAVCIEQCLERVRPICKMITEKIDKAERTTEEERDEEQLVREVRPLIEEGGRILTEAKGIIKGLDPDGRIGANAKHKTAAREATPEEYKLADVLKDLTGDVTQCIENAKRKLEDMPHAKKELNPLWGLLNEPLFQILAAVGLLLNGVLSLVGRLLSGLGLGGLVDGLLGTLGINRVLDGLGLGSVSKSLTGKDKKKKGGGMLGGLLG